MSEPFECNDENPCQDPGEICVYFLTADIRLEATACVKRYLIVEAKGKAFAFQNQVNITFSRNFAFGNAPVSLAEYLWCTSRKGCPELPTSELHSSCNWTDLETDAGLPIDCLTWEEANNYCEWTQARLCSEAEWELAVKLGLESNVYYREWVADTWHPEISSSMPKDGSAWFSHESPDSHVCRTEQERFEGLSSLRLPGLVVRCCSHVPIVGQH